MLKLEKIIRQNTKKAEVMLTKTDIKTFMEYYNLVCQLFKAPDPSAQSYEVSIITCPSLSLPCPSHNNGTSEQDCHTTVMYA